MLFILFYMNSFCLVGLFLDSCVHRAYNIIIHR
ncbi:hypothetical protein RF007C_01805 [Ruminococcus flavefaciens 007c]|uniref:Uncharacterized protein n=1 Tax=Ruminococcus flavefaciens 007c TaxID=1341157 RepID=W7V122_RUMFL|nr:hypothetical protein RF007C_01805 [Ruminococcus flavefaciens 007c]